MTPSECPRVWGHPHGQRAAVGKAGDMWGAGLGLVQPCCNLKHEIPFLSHHQANLCSAWVPEQPWHRAAALAAQEDEVPEGKSSARPCPTQPWATMSTFTSHTVLREQDTFSC